MPHLDIPRRIDSRDIRGTIRAGRRAARRFCRLCLGIVATCLFIVGGLNLALDPFWIYRGPWSSYWRPTERQMNSRVNKGEIAARDAIDVALLGDSRVLWGLDSTNPDLTAIGRTYNFGMVGTSIDEAAGMLDLLLRNPASRPKQVIWVIPPEFVAYDRRPQHILDYRLSRLNPDYDAIDRTLNSFWSRDAIEQSWGMMSSQRFDRSTLRAGYCHVTKPPPVTRESFLSHVEGQICHFAGEVGATNSNEMESLLFERFDRCAELGVRLQVMIPPSHAAYWEYLEDHGWGPRVQAGKRCLTKIVATANDKHRRSDSAWITLWDFSAGSGFIDEPLPSANTPLLMRWHSDCVHFKPCLGNEVVKVILDQPNAASEFGVKVTPANLELHLARTRSHKHLDREQSRVPHQVVDRAQDDRDNVRK